MWRVKSEEQQKEFLNKGNQRTRREKSKCNTRKYKANVSFK